MNASGPSLRLLVGAGAVVVILTGAATIALAAAGGAFRHGWVAPNGQCTAPALPGAVVSVTLTNMGGPMMGGAPMGATMRILTDRSSAPAGTVSLRVANTGSLVHELVVLPLPGGRSVGSRTVGTDGRVDETNTVAEASQTCGAGSGDGINPGTLGWTSVNLTPGTYELICNLPGHYAAGMYANLTVA